MSTTHDVPKMKLASPADVAALQVNDGVDLIDVRTPMEFTEVHAQGARLVPLDDLDPQRVMQSREGAKRPVYLICKSGGRAAKAWERFAAAGFAGDVACVEGGTDAWVREGLAVVRGRKGVSLERQVRIAAGTLVVVGVILAVFVHRYFYILPAFIGAGLVFSGVTDTCGMGMLLATCPWNRRRGCDTK